MKRSLRYNWESGGTDWAMDFIRVEGTHGQPYLFGESPAARMIEVSDIYVGFTAVTQATWDHVLGDGTNPSVNRGADLPVENVSWDDITRPGGFLDRLNGSPVREFVRANLTGSGAFRLPSETEWEYAARGGPRWREGFTHSGSNDPDAVAWYGRRDGRTHPVAGKAANQLGLYDMSGNVWEWCQDAFTRDTESIPCDGTAFVGPAAERVLRGGCFHNWAVHCTVSKRYEIGREYHDGCIGFRLVFSSNYDSA
jgi:formylglycine-generating enzyme required for sulfatase activity